MIRGKSVARLVVLALLACVAVTITSTEADAASTSEVVYHADGKVAGEVWFNSGYSAIHDGHPQYGENSFTVKDRFCGDGWGIGVEWELNGKYNVTYATKDCDPVEKTFVAALSQPRATRFQWRPFKWAIDGKNATTYEPWKSDWMGSDKSCRSPWMGRAATYGLIMNGYTFEVSMWPTRTARYYGKYKVSSLWSDLNRCVPLPTSLTDTQASSIYKQLYCHALFGVSSQLGGPTWDFEANRPDIPWSQVKNPLRNKKCNW